MNAKEEATMNNKQLSEVLKQALLRETLKQDLFSKDGICIGILNVLGDLENSFGNRKEEIKELVLKDSEVFRGFVILASTCALYMDHQWETEELFFKNPHWDQRNAASQEFCHQHKDVFQNIFRTYSGKTFPYRYPITYQRGFLADTQLLPGSILSQEITDFSVQHHTIQQKMLGTFFQIMGENGIYPELLKNQGFPFI